MDIVATVKRWLKMFFKNQAEKDFAVDLVKSPEMDALIKRCANIYNGSPNWLNDKDNIKTINFAKSICSEVARLTTLAIGIKIDGSARATWLQEQIDKVYFKIRDWVEFGGAYGTIIVKPNGKSFDVFTPFDFAITDCDNQNINGIIFRDSYQDGDWYYTRLEYHRFVETKTESGTSYPYYISNKAYKSRSTESIGDPVPLQQTKWGDLLDETPPILKSNGERLDGPMFAVLKMPGANNTDISSPMGLPVYHDAIEELKDLDIAYSRYVEEIFDSKRIVLADDRLLVRAGSPLKKMFMQGGRVVDSIARYVKNVFGSDQKEFYQEINPALNSDKRIVGINNLLSQIGYKIGFANGYFVFNEKSGIQTATGVEADQQRTIQFVKDVRDQLESALNEAIYAMSVYADLYALAPVGAYEITYDFGDITYNREEDRARWWQYVTLGKVPAWMYFVKFEGMSEEDAKAMVEEAKPDEEEGLFGEE